MLNLNAKYKPEVRQPSRWFVYAVDVLLVVFLIVVCMTTLSNYIVNEVNYIAFEVSEYLVNYQGGMIRRGLPGECLYRFCAFTGLRPVNVIAVWGLLFATGFAVFLIVNLRRYRVRWWILALLVTTVYASVMRKDFVMLALYMVILYVMRSEMRSWVKAAAVVAISVFMLLSYEAVIFMILPLVVLLLWSDKDMPQWITVLYVFILVAIMIMLMSLTGNPEIVDAIHRSWQTLMPDEFGDIPGATVQSMAWDVSESLRYNHSLLLPGTTLSTWIGCILVLCLWPCFYLRYFYMAVTSRRSIMPCTPAVFTGIFWVIMLCEMPLWLGLSCDYGRLLTQTLFVTLTTVFVLPEHRLASLLPQWIERGGAEIYRVYNKLPLNIYTLVILMLMFTVPYTRDLDIADFFKLSVFSKTANYIDYLWHLLMFKLS